MTTGREVSAETAPEVIGGPDRRALFQPIVDLRTGRPIGWEAQAGHDDGAGIGAPDAELALLASLATGGAPPDDGLVFVHVSAELIADPRLVEQCEQLGSRVVIDVRGSEVDRLDALSAQLDALATAGIHLSLENTSGVSLAMIARVRPSFVTLDAPLVRDIVHEPANRSVVRAYVAFAEHEDIHVIAEGVTSHEQLDELRNLGVVLARGSLFGQPTTDWAAPTTRRRRPPLVLDPLREVRERLSGAVDALDVARHLTHELRRLGERAAVYFESDGFLRCMAQEGHANILDGIPVRAGVLGRAFRGTAVEHATSAQTGDIEAAMAIRVDDRSIGVASIVGPEALTTDQEAYVATLVGAAGERLRDVGPPRSQSSMRRLAQAKIELAQITDVSEVEVAAARLASLVGGLSSAMFAVPGASGVEIKAVQGPLGAELRLLSPGTLAGLLDYLADASSCLSTTPGGDDGEVLTQLRAAGACSFIALPVRSNERGNGLLVLADHAPVSLDLDRREALELLARELGRTLDMVMVVEDLRTRATVDTLTGLGNLAAFQEALSTLGGRRRGRWALVMADVDGLKAVNDTHGHLTGDLALRSLAGAIHEVLRSDDRMYRIGGDEFAALLQDVDAGGAAEIGRRMCEAAASVMSDFGAGLSVGIAIPEQGELPTDFIDRADKMLYEVKRQARGTVRVAPPTGRRAD